MECEQLIRLIKDWYLRVKQETMAPARMMQFVDQHVKRCSVCQSDLLLPDEVEKIREFVFPESLMMRVGQLGDSSTPEISSDDDMLDDDDEDFSDGLVDDEDEDELEEIDSEEDDDE